MKRERREFDILTAARRLGLHHATLRRAIRTGYLKARIVANRYLITGTDLAAFDAARHGPQVSIDLVLDVEQLAEECQ